MIKVSVILPVYNVELYIQKAIDSLLHQTLQDMEFIFVDDCSTDNSLVIIKNNAILDKRIVLLQNIHNMGAGAARNKGIAIAKGEYLAFLDPDDYIDDNFYETLYNKAVENNLDIVKGNACFVETSLSPVAWTENSELHENILKSGDYKKYFVTAWVSAIYRKQLLDDYNIKFPEDIVAKEDMVFLFACRHAAKNFKMVENVYYYYYKRENSLTKIEHRAIDYYKSIEYRLDYLNKLKYSEAEYCLIYSDLLNAIKAYTDINKNKLFSEDNEQIYQIIFNIYTKCLYKSSLTKFNDMTLINILKSKNKGKLKKYLLSGNNSYSILEQIFSIKNSRDKRHKVVSIFGLKISLNRRKYKELKKV